jgi:hypothetical protein
MLLVVALAALLVPSTVHAASYGPPYDMGPTCPGDAGCTADQFNVIEADPQTGDMTVLRANPAGASGGLGCDGKAGYANFAKTMTTSGTFKSVTVSYTNALVDPYSYIKVSVRQNDAYLDTTNVRGAVIGDGSATVNLDPATSNSVREPVTGTITVWFGIVAGSSCPNVDGGHATFTSVTVTESA